MVVPKPTLFACVSLVIFLYVSKLSYLIFSHPFLYHWYPNLTGFLFLYVYNQYVYRPFSLVTHSYLTITFFPLPPFSHAVHFKSTIPYHIGYVWANFFLDIFRKEK
ncbi:hypothetical protein VIGAN_03235100 [Vigna angularis var. angularis]|uniref:Uncharacterized protein n=1 Tax=Vigna angularis var. angularis TaxID=157739 RepID=A0A0S3RP40_PHAAN|nr:hypothetical protein VIGAN_03235100 [Vigna angularis var. angularis]